MIPSNERKALKGIEDKLSADDPALAAYLAGRIVRRHPLRVSICCYTAIAAALFVGIGCHVLALIVISVILMPVMPVLTRRALRGPQRRRSGPSALE